MNVKKKLVDKLLPRVLKPKTTEKTCQTENRFASIQDLDDMKAKVNLLTK
jgi:hypothetical protein